MKSNVQTAPLPLVQTLLRARRVRRPLPPAWPLRDVLAEIDEQLNEPWNAEGKEYSKRKQLLCLRAAASREIAPSDYQLLLYSVGNPDFSQFHADGVLSPTVVVSGASMQDLIEAASSFISIYELGGGNCPHFRIFLKNVEVAHVSYNGRVWTPDEYGTPGHKEIDPLTGKIKQ